MSKKKKLKPRGEAEIPEMIKGHALELKGLVEALTLVLNRMDGAQMEESAQWAGIVTLRDGRVVDTGVFAKVREEDKAQGEEEPW